MTQPQRIALLMGQDTSFCRDVFCGIRAYAVEKRHWVFRNGAPQPEILGPLREWKPHGIIAHLFDSRVARAVLRLRLPLVDISCTLPNLKTPTVDVDHAAVGRLAAEHFLERGFVHFGFFGSHKGRYGAAREMSFRERLAEAGHTVAACHAEYLPQLPSTTSWRGMDQRVRRWLKQLPKPVAVLASNDVPARDLAEMCRQLELRVPDEVALLGVDNDEVECELSFPPLSSIAVPSSQIGYAAAELLDRMMAGQRVPPEPLFLPPVRVVTRQSTDTLAIGEPAVAEALNFIRRHAAEGISVGSVVKSVALGRRPLERKFRKLLGRTMLQEIRRARVEIAKDLLVSTNLPMPTIARHAGFANAARLCVVFRQLAGLTPSEYRNRSVLRERAP